LKLWTRKFLSHSLIGVAAGEAPGVVVAAGDVPVDGFVLGGDREVVAGVVPTAGESPGAVTAAFVTGAGAETAGLVAGLVAGFTAGFAAGFVTAGGTAGAGATGPLGGAVAAAGGGGGTWPNEVSAMVTEQRLAISSVFIG
jgi:hypothetical protein